MSVKEPIRQIEYKRRRIAYRVEIVTVDDVNAPISLTIYGYVNKFRPEDSRYYRLTTDPIDPEDLDEVKRLVEKDFRESNLDISVARTII